MLLSSRRTTRILPSILACDYTKMGEETKAVAQAGADYIHIDIMDGHFVPNITFGPDIVKALRKSTNVPFDVHLMIQPVDPFLEAFAAAGADIITAHAEAGPNLHRSLQVIRALGKKAGVSINPATPENAIEHVLDVVDLVLVMTVNPGFGGQKFIPSMLEKIRRIRAMIGARNIALEVDGGVTAENAGACVAAGADYLVAGSSVFQGGPNRYAENIATLRRAADGALGVIA